MQIYQQYQVSCLLAKIVISCDIVYADQQLSAEQVVCYIYVCNLNIEH